MSEFVTCARVLIDSLSWVAVVVDWRGVVSLVPDASKAGARWGSSSGRALAVVAL